MMKEDTQTQISHTWEVNSDMFFSIIPYKKW
jgi:hypothetical protein